VTSALLFIVPWNYFYQQDVFGFRLCKLVQLLHFFGDVVLKLMFGLQKNEAGVAMLMCSSLLIQKEEHTGFLPS
jgi:hypothetical protein